MTEDVNTVEIRLPAEARYLRVARLTASALAADLDFGMDQLDEIKVAVDELGAVLLGDAGDGDIELRYETSADQLAVSGRRRARGEIKLDPIAIELLDIVTDDYDLATDGEHHTFRLRKTSGHHGDGS